MDLSKAKIKNLDREDVSGLKDFFDVISNHDQLEIRMPEHVIENILSRTELKEDIFLLYFEDNIIGFAGCMRNVSNAKNAFFQELIHPAYRQQGIGRKLYDIFLEHLKKNDIKKVRTVVNEHMPQSISFLQRRGFIMDSYMWKMNMELGDMEYIKTPTEKYNIRVATIEDNKDYVDIMNSGFKEEGEELYTDRSFIRIFGSADKHIFFIEQNSKIVATVAISLQKDKDRGYITNLTVYKDFRRKGFGEIALCHCINVAKEAGLQNVALNVDGTNTNALNLYEKIGFVKKYTEKIFELQL